MTKTFTRTMFIENLTEAKIVLFVTDAPKYEAKEDGIRVEYTGVKAWSIVDGEDAKEIEADTDGSCIDENHEYLVLHFEDGETSTFRNSHVDMFIR